MYYGAGILATGCTPIINNNTITQNRCTSTSSTARGGGLYSVSGAFNGVNDIVCGNIATLNPEFYGTTDLTYSCSSEAIWGVGNIVDDPEFVDPEQDNFHLMAISPCIDTGDPGSPLDPDGSRADMGALYFDQSGGALLIPNAPTNFTVSHNGAALIATLNWINPSITANNLPLTELDGVKVYRGGVLLANLTNMVIGAPASYDDSTIPAPNPYDYEIVPYNSHGDGIPAEASAWIGLDVPGLPSNVVATPDPGQQLLCTIAWTAPTQGGHGGYWPPGSWISQKVYRNGSLIATLLGTNTLYLDNAVPIQGWYTYGVSYYNATGEGDVQNATPSPVFVGPPQFQQIPYNWVEISGVGANTGITLDDQNLGPFNIGFSFPWYDGEFYSSIRVCSNGFASFTSTSNSWTNMAIPNSGEPNNLIAPYWDDLNPFSGGTIWYYFDAANSRFIVEWDNVMSYTSPQTPQKFEIILYPNGDIDFMYHTAQAPCLNANSVGIENAAGTEGIQVTYNGSGPLEPASGMGIRIFSVSAGVPEVSVTLTPYGAPIQIPASGGRFNYNIAVANNGASQVTADVWCMATLPNGHNWGPLLGPVEIIMPVGFNINRDRTQAVPGVAPAGNYVYHGYIGDYPGTIWDEDSFPFTKLTTGDGPWYDEWLNMGEPFDEWMAGRNPVPAPDVFALHPNYPNPFNPRTTIRFQLPEASHVKLAIYNVNGRLVADLVNGMRQAGYHEVTWDATGLASGMYICRVQAGDFTGLQKMMLVK